MIRRIAAVLLMWSALFSVQASGISFETLAQKTRNPDMLQGLFHQEKYLAAFELTLDSSGQFVYQKGRSIHWQTLEPVENELILTPDSIVNRQGGEELMRLDAAQGDAISVFSQIFFAVMTAQWEQLERYFSLEGQADGDDWQVKLTPTDNRFSQLIRSVELSGKGFMEQVVLHEQSGNRTQIRFTDLRDSVER